MTRPGGPVGPEAAAVALVAHLVGMLTPVLHLAAVMMRPEAASGRRDQDQSV
jgi:hypothetical protein